jgi:NadR type nicotinamide-nucleotide adenylyltransferase
MEYSKLIEAPVRGYFAHRVVIVGAESTGTTTLARALAEHYQTTWAPEYGRLYSEGKWSGAKRETWSSEEFVHIARMQNQLENAMAEISNGLLISDTNAWATGLWHERYLGSRNDQVEAIAKECVADLYIVTGDEIPFVQDGYRDGEHIRHQMQQRFIGRLKEESKQYIVVSGSVEERLSASIKAIEEIKN